MKYRLQMPGFELPQAVLLAQQRFDNLSVGMLDDLAGLLDRKAPRGNDNFEDSFRQLPQTIQNYLSEGQQELLCTKL